MKSEADGGGGLGANISWSVDELLFFVASVVLKFKKCKMKFLSLSVRLFSEIIISVFGVFSNLQLIELSVDVLSNPWPFYSKRSSSSTAAVVAVIVVAAAVVAVIVVAVVVVVEVVVVVVAAVVVAVVVVVAAAVVVAVVVVVAAAVVVAVVVVVAAAVVVTAAAVVAVTVDYLTKAFVFFPESDASNLKIKTN